MKFKATLFKNRTMLTREGLIKFVGGYYETKDKAKIEILKKVEDVEVISEAGPVITSEDKDDKNKVERRTSIPASWTLAKLYEYADSIGVIVPEDLSEKKEITSYLLKL
jgi:hypothetical protein